jgi:D-xylose transport system ATP-binding protein
MVLDLVKTLRDRGYGVLVISHNLGDVFQVADRIFVLRLGQKAGEFGRDASQDQVVAAITGSSGNGGKQ